ncbi:Uncharacterised protein g11267 [Pycnogonum litorale]
MAVSSLAFKFPLYAENHYLRKIPYACKANFKRKVTSSWNYSMMRRFRSSITQTNSDPLVNSTDDQKGNDNY